MSTTSGGPNIVTSGLVLYLDAANTQSYSGTGTVWNDLSGNNYNATLNGGTSFNNANVGNINLNGSDATIIIPYSSYWDSNVFGSATNFTISCWIKPNLFRNWDTIIAKANFNGIGGWYSANEGPALWADSSGFVAVFSSGVASNPSGSILQIFYSTSNTQKWYHLCFTGDGTNLRFYVDGVLIGSVTAASRTHPLTTSTIGPAFGSRAFWGGQISNSIFYTRGITASEVLQNYNAQKSRFGLP